MSYQSIVVMASSQSLQARVVAAAATLGVNNPLSWVQTHIWHIVSAPDWDIEWEQALTNQQPYMNPDIGVRDDVITDEMISSAVTDIMQEEMQA